MDRFIEFVIANQEALVAVAGAIILEFAPKISEWYDRLTSNQRFWAFFLYAMSTALGLGLWEAIQAGWPGWEAIPGILLNALMAWLAGSGWHLIYKNYQRAAAVKRYFENLPE